MAATTVLPRPRAYDDSFFKPITLWLTTTDHKLIGIMYMVTGILSFIRLDWVQTIVSYLPLPASSALLTTGAVETQGAYLSAQASLIVMAAYAVVPIAAAAVTLH